MVNLSKDKKEEKVPVLRVLDDMYNPNGGLVSLAARDYYYENYATEKERKEMDREDAVLVAVGWILVGVFSVGLIASIVLPFL